MGKHAVSMPLVLLLALIMSVCPISPAHAIDDAAEAERLWEMGEKASGAGRNDEAILYYEKSLAMTRRLNHFEGVASNLNGLGVVYEAKGDYTKALSYYEAAVEAARKIDHRDLIATNLFNMGVIYNLNLGQYERALSLFEESLRMFRDLNDKDSIALVLFNLGKAANAMGRYEKALSHLNDSLQMNRELKNQQGMAATQNFLGNVYAKMGQYDRPLAYYQEALKTNRQLNLPVEVATTLRNMGDAYCDLVEFDKALPYYQEALDIQKRQGDREGAAITLNNIGAYYRNVSQFDKALSYYQEALKVNKEIGNDALTATSLNNIGQVQADLGRPEEALASYRQSLDLERRLSRPYNTAIVLNNIGMEYFRIGRYEQAISSLNEALAIERQLNNPHTIAARLNNIGAVHLRQKRYREAEDVFLERKNLERRIVKTRLIHAGLTEVYSATRRYDDALALLRELPPNWRDNRNRRMEYHTQLGQALKGKGLLRESMQEFLKAVSIVEEIRQAVSERGGFFAGGGYISRLTPHRELVAVLSQMAARGERMDDGLRPYGRDLASAAFYFSELTKARTLLETIAGAAGTYDAPDIPADIKQRESDLLGEVSAVESNWENSYAKGEAVFKRVSQQREELARELDSFISLLRKNYPAYAAIRYPRPVPPEELPLGEHEVLIEFGVSSDAAVVFVVRKGGVMAIHTIAASKDELAGKVKKIMAPLSSGEQAEFPVKAARELYGLLLSDAVKDVKDGEKLVIVPDGILGLLPFEALVTQEGKDVTDSVYAGDKWAVVYSQSAAALALTRLLKPSAAGKPLFALGNPVYDRSDPRYTAYKQGKPLETVPARNPAQYAYRGVTVAPKGEGMTGGTGTGEEVVYPPLPETETEVKEIARLLNVRPEPPDVLLNLAANETGLRQARLRDYRTLHFATHADLPGNVKGIQEPFLLLGQVENRNDDGFLTLTEVLGLDLDADLAVLSACVTGRGRLMEGEGVASFARAFQYAGTRSVVVSLWEVASSAAVEYMKAFYRHLGEGHGRAEALSRARKEIKAKYPDPFYWSVFVLYGEG